ncbi:DUF3276 family protein [Treponema pectinovorum]|uniref:DUF3276 family protein n=1 Tax=Treponema pectinovorum TaxID=164 RepID=UPI0011C9A304|nr:DUF3276 family protein [Treponema pectinovorum]
MGIRGELYTTEVVLDNRSYFFNVKENRNGDIFLQIVESKKGDGSDFDRHQISIFQEDMQKVLGGLDEALKYIDKEQKNRKKARSEKKAIKAEKYGAKSQKKVYRRKTDDDKRLPDGIKRTGKVIHIKSKIETPAEE